MEVYRHTQIGWVLIVCLGLSCLLLTSIFLLSGQINAVGLGVLAILLFCLVFMSSMTVTVGGDGLEVSLGWGLLRKRIAREEIESAAIVRNPWYYGWGIKFIPGGRLWNVSGFHAVELNLKDKGSFRMRRFRIGTDDPQGVIRALASIGIRRDFSCDDPDESGAEKELKT